MRAVYHMWQLLLHHQLKVLLLACRGNCTTVPALLFCRVTVYMLFSVETTDMSSPGSNPSSGPEMNSLHVIIGVVSFGVTLTVAALVLTVLVVWIVKW